MGIRLTNGMKRVVSVSGRHRTLIMVPSTRISAPMREGEEVSVSIPIDLPDSSLPDLECLNGNLQITHSEVVNGRELRLKLMPCAGATIGAFTEALRVACVDGEQVDPAMCSFMALFPES